MGLTVYQRVRAVRARLPRRDDTGPAPVDLESLTDVVRELAEAVEILAYGSQSLEDDAL